ncbi:hypothetical protein [Streptomyces sp. NPDC101132]|uniref:hypothetical protein n=1 Tax=Streptomyces sp. NPDC101132 TaxID=3366110 RepID=UPI0038109E9B
MSEQPPVTGPIPIYVKRTPGGAALDMSALTAHVISDVIDALIDPESTDLWDLLQAVANPPARAEGDTDPLDREQLETALTARASSRVPLYGPAVTRLAERLLAAVRIAVPKQRRAS